MKRVLLALLLLVAACANEPPLTASVISTANTIGVGEQRILVEFSDDPGEVVAVLRDENGSPLDESSGEMVWLVPDDRAAHVFYVEIPQAETYQMTFEVGSDVFGPAGFVAVDDPVQVTVSEKAPADLGEVVVFASPSRCPSGTCQAMIDIVDRATDGVFVLVEVFADPESDTPVLSAGVEAWGIPGQPWLYVIDTRGIVTAVFEGAVSEVELEDALASG